MPGVVYTFGFEVETTYRNAWHLHRRWPRWFKRPWTDGSGPEETNSRPFHWLSPVPALLALDVRLPSCPEDANGCGNHFHVKPPKWWRPEDPALVYYHLSIVGYRFLASWLNARASWDDHFQPSRPRWAGAVYEEYDEYRGEIYPEDSKDHLLTYNTCCHTLENRACEASPLRCYLLHWLATALLLEGWRPRREACWLPAYARAWRRVLRKPRPYTAFLPAACPAPRTIWELVLLADRLEARYPVRMGKARLPVARLVRAVILEGNRLASWEDLERVLGTARTELIREEAYRIARGASLPVDYDEPYMPEPEEEVPPVEPAKPGHQPEPVPENHHAEEGRVEQEAPRAYTIAELRAMGYPI